MLRLPVGRGAGPVPEARAGTGTEPGVPVRRAEIER